MENFPDKNFFVIYIKFCKVKIYLELQQFDNFTKFAKFLSQFSSQIITHF